MLERRDKEVKLIPHQLIMQDRTKLELSGVIEVESFDESLVLCRTSFGLLSIRGSDLHVFRLDLDGTSLSVEGHIESLTYTDVRKGGLFGRLLR